MTTSIVKVIRDKDVAGVHWPMFIFFMSWSTWNIYLFYSFSLWLSLVGGAAMLVTELVYILLLIKYSRKSDG